MTFLVPIGKVRNGASGSRAHRLARATAGTAQVHWFRLRDKGDLAARITDPHLPMLSEARGVVEKACGHTPISLPLPSARQHFGEIAIPANPSASTRPKSPYILFVEEISRSHFPGTGFSAISRPSSNQPCLIGP